MDRLEKDCPPDAFKKAVNYAKQHNMALISGTDANAHNTYWNSRITDKAGADRGNSLLSYTAKEKLFVENVGDTPTFDNGRWTNSIDLTLTNAKGHDLMDENCSDHNFITYNISPKSGFSKTKFRDIAKTDWQIYQDELTRHMTNTADVFNNLITSTDIDKAACQLAANVRSAFNSACKKNYASNKVRSPPWETPEVREAKAGIKHRLRQAINTKSDKDWSELRSHQAEYHRLRSHTTKTKFKPDGRLTESPEETLKVMVDTHFTSLNAPPQDNPTGHNRADNHISSGENRSGENHSGDNRTYTTSSSDLDRIFLPKRMKKSLAEFDPLSAAGPDGIRPVMLQKAWETINAAYTNIAKASYRTSHTPVCWRNATGIFLPKPGKGDYYNP